MHLPKQDNEKNQVKRETSSYYIKREKYDIYS